MKKIVIIASYADSLVNFRGDLIRDLLKKGLDVHLLAPKITSNVNVNSLIDAGVSVHNIPMERTGANPLHDLKTLWAIWRLCMKIRPEYMLAYTAKPVVYGTLASYFAGVHNRYVMITGLGYAFQYENARSFIRKILGFLYKVSLSKASAVIFQNPDDLSLFYDQGILAKSKSVAIVNGSGVDTEYFKQTPLPEKISCLLIGRLLGDKGVREYVDAARILKVRHPSVEFKLAGWIDKNPTAISQQELDQWVSEKIIVFLGKLSDVRPVLNDSTIFVLPSYREGTPRTVLEAMSVGRPIVTTNAPGCKETVVEGYNGYLVPIKNAKELAVCIEKLIVDVKVRESMSLNSRILALEKYNVHKVNEQILSVMKL